MSDKEATIQRVINFIYDALDRFRDTMNELNQNVAGLMDNLEKARGDLSGTGYQRTGTDRSAVLSTISKRGPASSSSSREKLISLLSGQTPTPPRPAAAPASAAARAPMPPRPAAGPPRPPGAVPAAGPPRPPGVPPAAAPPRPPGVPPAAAPPRPPGVPPAAAPPRPPGVPPAAAPPRPPAVPPAAAPPRPPAAVPAAGPPAPAVPYPPTVAGPLRTAGPAPSGQAGAPTISGLRDEMLKELKRLKSIMKGEK